MFIRALILGKRGTSRRKVRFQVLSPLFTRVLTRNAQIYRRFYQPQQPACNCIPSLPFRVAAAPSLVPRRGPDFGEYFAGCLCLRAGVRGALGVLHFSSQAPLRSRKFFIFVREGFTEEEEEEEEGYPVAYPQSVAQAPHLLRHLRQSLDAPQI